MNLDRAAIGSGAVLALSIVVPATVLGLIVDIAAIRSLTFAAVMVGFGAGGYRAATADRDTPLTSAAMSALVAFGVVQGIGIVLRIATGRPVSIPAIAFMALIASSCAMVGAWLRLRRGQASAGA